MGFSYTTKMESIGIFLTNIAKGGKPAKVDNSYLQALGLKSSNDRPLIPLFKALGFVGQSGVPADRWSQYRDQGKSKAVLAEGIMEAYPEFFATYPDAHIQANDLLKNVVKAKTDLGDAGADSVVRTFKTLVNHADFSTVANTSGSSSNNNSSSGSGGSNSGSGSGGKSGGGQDNRATPQVAINIQLQLPAEADEDTYDKLFAAMAKHLKL